MTVEARAKDTRNLPELLSLLPLPHLLYIQELCNALLADAEARQTAIPRREGAYWEPLYFQSF